MGQNSKYKPRPIIHLQPHQNTNIYTISYQDSVGTNHYICTCLTAYGTNTTSQIRTTEDPDLALNVKVVASTEDEGVWYLLNTEANQYLGSNGDYGFANGDYTSLSLTTATPATATLTVTEAKWATLILPFAADIPQDIEVYAAEGTTGETTAEGYEYVQLEQVTTITANTPYIVYGQPGSYTFQNYGTAAATTYTNGFLTGVYTPVTAEQGTYVLQNQNNKIGFYKVTETSGNINIQTYRAYMNATDDSSQAAARLLIPTDNTTNINAITENSDTTVNVYTLSGQTIRTNVTATQALQGLNRGIYIVNGTKHVVK